MNEEIKALLDGLKAEVQRIGGGLARLDAVERKLAEGALSETAAKAELERCRAEIGEIKAEHTRIVRDSRLVQARREGVVEREHGLVVMGAICRQLMAERQRVDIPARFKGEAQIVREYIERATLEAGATTGSYAIPTIMSQEIIDTLEEVSDLVARTDFQPDLPGNVDFPTIAGRPTLQHARASVDTAMTASDPTFGQLQVRPDEGYCYFGVDNRLIQMSPLALGQVFLNLTREGVVGGLATDLLSGDGTSTYNGITGILNESTAAYVYTMPSGKTAFSDLTATYLRAAMAKALKRGRANGVWVLSLDVLGVIEDLDRTGKVPVVSYSPTGETLVFRRPVVIDEGMPDSADSAAAKAFFGFGDLRTYMVGLVGGIQIATSEHVRFDKNQTAFRGTVNFDIKRKPVATFITGKTAAS
jgi:HK97 family phage major capsid protein